MAAGKLPLAPHPEMARLRRTLNADASLTRAWSGVAFRSTSPAYARSRDLLSGEGVRRHGGRWNPPGEFAAVYASLKPETALAEALAQFRRYGLPDDAAMPRVMVAVEANLSRLLDLTDRRVRRALRFSRRRLVEEDWRREQGDGREALTQSVGRAAYEEGIEGMLAPAAALWSATNLVVFPAALRDESFLRVLSPVQATPATSDAAGAVPDTRGSS